MNENLILLTELTSFKLFVLDANLTAIVALQAGAGTPYTSVDMQGRAYTLNTTKFLGSYQPEFDIIENDGLTVEDTYNVYFIGTKDPINVTLATYNTLVTAMASETPAVQTIKDTSGNTWKIGNQDIIAMIQNRTRN